MSTWREELEFWGICLRESVALDALAAKTLDGPRRAEADGAQAEMLAILREIRDALCPKAGQ